jgi:hypothetical protein
MGIACRRPVCGFVAALASGLTRFMTLHGVFIFVQLWM